MRKSSWIVIAIIALLLALCATALAWLVERVPVEQRTGFSKEAQENRFLAGELLLRRLGYDARTLEDRQAFDQQPLHSTLLLESDDAFADPKLRERLLDWVRRGGHLVLPLESTGNDKLLGALGIDVEGRLNGQTLRYSLPLEGQRLAAQISSVPVFSLDAEPQWSIDLLGHFSGSDAATSQKRGKRATLPTFTARVTQDSTYGSPIQARQGKTLQSDNDETQSEEDDAPQDSEKDAEPDTTTLYARYAFGKGLVTVGSFTLFSNRSIDKFDHAVLFARLLTLPERKQPITILFAPKYPGLLEWLADHASEAWFAAIILLIAGLWRVIPRFGPLLPEAPPVRPGLGEHLTACGHFLLHRRTYEYLIMPLREDVLRALDEQRHLHPEIPNRTALAAHLSGMRAADIDRALTPEPDTHHEFLRRVQTLAALRTLCKQLRKPSSVSGALS